MTFDLGPLHVQAGNMRTTLLDRWFVRDGLHIWIQNRGVHLYWCPPGIEFDTYDPDTL